MTEIGSCNAVLRSVKTTLDGSVQIQLELNTDEKEIIMKLVGLFADNKKFMSVGFVSIDD